MSAGAARIRVSFQVDADGLLSVTASEQSSGVAASIAVRPSYGLSDDEIADMLQSAFAAAGEDRVLRALREQQVEARRLIEATQAALTQDAALLGEQERQAIETLMAKAAQAASGQDPDVIRQAVEGLALGTETFAARRMDQAVSRALAGRRVDELDH